MATIRPTRERLPDLEGDAHPSEPRTEPRDGNGHVGGRVQEAGERHAVATETARPRTHEPLPSLALEPPPSRRRGRLLLLVPILLVIAAIAVTIGYRYWYESTYF